MIFKRLQPRRLLAALVLLMTPFGSAAAGPWAESGHAQLRHHVQQLIDHRVLRTTSGTWPLPWQALLEELEAVDPAYLSENLLWSYRYVQFELRKATRRAALWQRTSYANLPQPLTYFGDKSRDDKSFELSLNLTGSRFAANLQVSAVDDPIDGEELRFDGSQISAVVGNWAVGIGSVDRWWGPGWENSLILSHNARPVPAVFLSRQSAKAFQTPLLNWLGPWHFTTFLGQMESDRAVPRALLYGARLNFAPLPGLDIGLSRTAQWGGRGRPSDTGAFLDMLLGRDNYGDRGVAEDRSNEPGNQLAGIDLRYAHPVGSGAAALYMQLIGEDEAGGLPSRHIGMAGAEYSFTGFNISQRFSFEATNTTVYFYEPEKKRGNVAYEHSLYHSGYRHYGRALGATFDNDTEALQLRWQGQAQNGASFGWHVGHLRINGDGVGKAPPGGTLFGNAEQATTVFGANAIVPLSPRTRVKLSFDHYDKPLHFAGEILEQRASITLESYL